MAVVSVLLSHRKAGSCEEDIGFSERAELSGMSRLPQRLRTRRTRRLFVISSEWVRSCSHMSVDPVACMAPFFSDITEQGEEKCAWPGWTTASSANIVLS